MRKYKFLIWFIVILLGMPACGTQSSQAPTQAPAGKATQPDSWQAGPVAILVLDDFKIDQGGSIDFINYPFVDIRADLRHVEKLPLYEAETPATDTCVYDIDGQAAHSSLGAALHSSLGAEVAGSNSGVAHGFLVYDQFVDLIENDAASGYALNQLASDSNGQELFKLDWMPKIRKYVHDGQELVLAAVDTSQYSTDAVAERLKAAVEAFKGAGYTRFVINMSFVIIPCRDDPDKVSETFQLYEQAVQADPALTGLQATVAELRVNEYELAPEATARMAVDPVLNSVRLRSYYTFDAPLAKDEFQLKFNEVIEVPLHDVLIEILKDESLTILPVAAAGNQGLTYPFAPAMWDEVLSVSAYEAQNAGKAEYSNAGEVKMFGQTLFRGKDETHGTSFAAPRLSYQAAMYLLHGGPLKCSGRQGTSPNPLLGYAAQDGNWQNMALEKASDDYCSDFLVEFKHAIPEQNKPADAEPAVCQDALGCIEIAPADPVHIAYALTLSGDTEPYGKEIYNSIELALQARDWQLLGHSILLDGLDIPCNSDGGELLGQSLTGDASIAGIIGPICSSSAFAATPHISNAGMLMISPANSRANLTSPDEHMPGYFRTASNDRRQAEMAAEFAINSLGVKLAATIAVSGNGYSEDLVQVFKDRFSELGGELTTQDGVDDSTDLSALLDSIASRQPQLIYFPIFSPQNIEVAAKARSYAGLENTILFTSDVFDNPESIQAAGADAIGTYLTDWNLPHDSEDYKVFLERWQARYGSLPAYNSHVQAYDAVGLLLYAIENVAYQYADGSLAIPRQALREYLYSGKEYAGLGGVLSCTATGDCAAPQSLAIYQVTMDNVNGAWPLPVVWTP